MKIRGSRYRLPPREPEPDPADILYEKERQELDEKLAALRARHAELEQTIAKLRHKLGYDVDWLVFLPPDAVPPDFMDRACQYLEAMRGRVEAGGAKMWLCKDHDFVTHIFHIDQFRAMAGAVYCSGKFTDPKYRDVFRGTSVDDVTFAGDFDLLGELAKAAPPNCLKRSDLPADRRAAAQSDAVFGLCGAACLDTEPSCGRSRIFHLDRIAPPTHKPSAYAQSLAERKREET